MNEVSKFRCHVYGCTIPAGIFHEHPSAPLMRDPNKPLDAHERAELDQLRREARQRQHTEQHRAFLYAQSHQNAFASLGMGLQHDPDTATAQARAADQLADAIRYGYAFSQNGQYIPVKDVFVVPEGAPIHGGRKLTQALLEAGRIRRENADLGVVFNEAPTPRRSFISTIARVAFWIVLAVTVAIWIFAGVKS